MLLRKILFTAALLNICILSALYLRYFLLDNELNSTQLLKLLVVSLNLEYTVNTGINFGLAGEATSSRQFLLAALSVFICLVALIWGVITTSKWAVIIASLLAGGGLANAYERIAFGGVFDYLNVSLSFFANPYSFNIADIYIFIGALMFIFRPQIKAYE